MDSLRERRVWRLRIVGVCALVLLLLSSTSAAASGNIIGALEGVDADGIFGLRESENRAELRTKELAGAMVTDIDAKPLVQSQAKWTQQETAVRRMDLLEPWRLRVVRPFVRGRLLDLGCGYNNLSRAHGFGLGADVFPWEGIDVRSEDAARLPFRDGSFDTVSVVAALNHIPNREAALLAVMRVLRLGGLFLATMIGPWTGRLAHMVFHQDEARRGGMRAGETDGSRHRNWCSS